MPRLLNARLAPPDQLISNTQNQFEVFNRYNQPDRLNPTLTSIMHLDNQGKLQLAAQWLGDVHSRVCAPRGECILILTNPFNYDSAAWYSPDGGAKWQPLAEWQFPKSDSEARIDPQKLIAFDDAGKLWAAGNYTLSVSADRGKSWQTMADIRPLLRRNNILATRASEPGVTLYRLHWYLDNHQRLLADITVSLPDGRGDRRFLYQIISDSQERLLATDIHSLAQSPQGEIFLTRPSDRPTRYGLYQLQSDDSLRLVMEHIDRLGEIYAGRTVLALEKGIGDGAHLYLSRDGGQTWRRYQEVQDKPVFAPWRDSFVRLPRYTRLTHYHTAALN
ncbi:hypothetical protein [Entomohabitans teleogrylli]|uniref:hypothetical protein n=1 Tax=Entomohabitans teleogrylli TaxID=1384589 RepID=UPI00073D7371|nr:hypothetical protein [Entomohabitans teleogrylli]